MCTLFLGKDVRIFSLKHQHFVKIDAEIGFSRPGIIG